MSKEFLNFVDKVTALSKINDQLSENTKRGIEIIIECTELCLKNTTSNNYYTIGQALELLKKERSRDIKIIDGLLQEYKTESERNT